VPAWRRFLLELQGPVQDTPFAVLDRTTIDPLRGTRPCAFPALSAAAMQALGERLGRLMRAGDVVAWLVRWAPARRRSRRGSRAG